jgi:hypothetical protein
MDKKLTVLSVGIMLISASIVSMGFFIGRGFERFKREDHTISVRGLAEQVVQSNQAVWNISFSVTGDDLISLEQKLAEDSTTVLEFLKAQGFKEEEITQSAPSITDHQANGVAIKKDETLPPRYVVSRSLFVKTPNVFLVRDSVAKTSDLMRAGINFSSSGDDYRANPRYLLTNFNELRPGLLEASAKNARSVAEKFASDSGGKIGRVRAAQQGSIQIQAVGTGEDSWSQNEEKAIEKQLRVVSNFTFDLE